MSRLTDALEALEYKLDKYRGDDASSLLNRRLVLRESMQAWGDERYRDGHYDGGRDERDPQREAKRRADEAAAEAKADTVTVSRADLEVAVARMVIDGEWAEGVRDRLREALGDDGDG